MDYLVQWIKTHYGEDGFTQMVEVSKCSPYSLPQVVYRLPTIPGWRTMKPDEAARMLVIKTQFGIDLSALKEWASK